MTIHIIAGAEHVFGHFVLVAFSTHFELNLLKGSFALVAPVLVTTPATHHGVITSARVNVTV